MFNNCINLKRVFGHLCIDSQKTCTSLFNECNKFSIKGYYEENGEYSLIGLKFKEKDICDSRGRVKHLSEFYDDYYNSSTIDFFEDSTSSTNISIKPGNTSLNLNLAFYRTSTTIFDIYYLLEVIGKNYSGELILSNCFNVEGLKDSKPGNSNRFFWNNDTDNSPNRNIFRSCGDKLINIENIFRSRGLTSTNIRLYSTTFKITETANITNEYFVTNNKFTINSDRYTISSNYDNVIDETGNNYPIINKKFTINTIEYLIDIRDTGIFYYNNRLNTIKTFIYDARYFCSNDIFITKNYWESGESNSLTLLNYFGPYLIINGIDYVNYSDIFTEYELKPNLLNEIDTYDLGDISRLFKPCQNLNNLKNTLYQVYFIDYGKSNDISIPINITEITASFYSTYGSGEFRLDRLFNFNNDTEKSTLEKIQQSFYIVGKTKDDIQPYTYLTNDYFSKFPKLENIGYKPNGTDLPGLTSLHASFSGIKKYVRLPNNDKNEFPYKILEGLENLEVFAAGFKDCEIVDSNDEYCNVIIDLPGDLFKKNTKLTNISRCFENFKGRINLTSNSFESCTLLSDVSYLFKISISNIEKNRNSGIVSHIPYKFFYHGNSTITTSKIVKGTDNTYTITGVKLENGIYTKTEGNLIYNYNNIIEFNSETKDLTISPLTKISKYKTENDGMGNPVTTLIEEKFQGLGDEDFDSIDDDGNLKYIKTIQYNDVNKKIKNLNECFSGQGWIDYYKYNSDSGEYEKSIFVEYYQPFNYIFNNSWQDKTESKCMLTESIIWSFDGNYDNPSWDETDRLIFTEYLEPDFPNEDYESINIIHPNDKQVTSTTYYFCPPDLFRYCTNSSDLNISNIFYNCGYTNHVGLGSEDSTNPSSNINFGIKGRICHYLLKPVTNVTSISGMFTNCKNLSPFFKYETNGESTQYYYYLIPRTFLTFTENLTNLSGAFKGLLFPKDSIGSAFKIIPNNIGNTSSKRLNITEIFQYPYLYNTTNYTGNAKINGVFTNCFIGEAKRVFSIDNSPDSLTTNHSYRRSQYIDFGINFTKAKFSQDNYSATKNAKVLSVYDGYSSSYVSFSGLKSDKTSEEFKYHNNNLLALPYNYRTL